MKRSVAVEVLTAVSMHGGWVKLLQVRREPQGALKVLGLKARRMPPEDEGLTVQALAGLVKGLPEPVRQVVGLFPAEGILTRTLTLPSQDPAELRAMAAYQLEGLLPYSVQECVVSIKVLGSAGEATRVLAAVAQRAEIERMLRICRAAGLELTELACSTEAVGRWHQACWPKGLPAAAGWLVAELTLEGLELAVLVGGSLVYMRQVPLAIADADEAATRIAETLQAYQTEKAGPPVQRVTLSGWTDPLTPEVLDRMQIQLGLPIHAVDPLETSPFGDMLAVAVREAAPEVSFSELLGVASAPRMLELDLLPEETRHDQLRAGQLRHLRRDRQFHPMARTEREGRVRGPHTLGHHLHLRQNFIQLAPLSKLNTNAPVARQPAHASQHQIAHASQPSQGFGPASQGHCQPRHFGQTTGG